MTLLTVFVNGTAVRLDASAKVLDSVRSWSESAARQLETGDLTVTDSRGLPTALTAPLHGGAILRLGAARAAGRGPTEDPGF